MSRYEFTHSTIYLYVVCIVDVREVTFLEQETVAVVSAPHQPPQQPQEEVQPPPTATVEFTALSFLEKIGKGGFGVVWRGTWETDRGSTVVAIKQVKTADTEDKEVSLFYHC